MDLAFLEQLIDLVGRSPIRELDLAQDAWRVRLVKDAPGAAGPGPGPGDARTEAADAPPAPGAERHLVLAGVAGTFYRAPGPGLPPFVEPGGAVAEGQRLGTLEAMKTFLPVEADRAGRVEAVLKQDGAAVGAGDPLFALVPENG